MCLLPGSRYHNMPDAPAYTKYFLHFLVSGAQPPYLYCVLINILLYSGARNVRSRDRCLRFNVEPDQLLPNSSRQRILKSYNRKPYSSPIVASVNLSAGPQPTPTSRSMADIWRPPIIPGRLAVSFIHLRGRAVINMCLPAILPR